MARSVMLLTMMVALAVTARTASASDDFSFEELDRKLSSEAILGPYVHFGGGGAWQDFEPDGTALGRLAPPIEDHFTGVVTGGAGWRFHPHVGSELTWQYASGWSFPSGANSPNELSMWSVTANVKVYPFLWTVQPFLMAGIGVGRRTAEGDVLVFSPGDGSTTRIRDARDTDLMSRFGAGLETVLTQRWSLVYELVYFVGAGDLRDNRYLATTLAIQLFLT